MFFIKRNLFWIVTKAFIMFTYILDQFLLIPNYGSPIFSIKSCLRIVLIFMVFDVLLQNKTLFGKFESFFSKTANFLEAYSISIIILSIFIFSILAKLFYLKFDLSTDYISVKNLFDAVYYDNNWFYELDDSPIHTAIGAASYWLFGPEKMEPIVFIQIILGSISICLASLVFHSILKNKIITLIVGMFLATYVQVLNWEAVIRYDTLSTMFHVMGIFGLFYYLSIPTYKNLIIFLLCLFFALIGKETVVYMLPYYVGLIFVCSRFNKDIKLRPVMLSVLISTATMLGLLSIRDSLNIKHFGVTSIKKPIVLLWNMQMFDILKPDMPTKYPQLRDELWDYHRKYFTDDDDKLNIIQKTQTNLKFYHEYSDQWLFERDGSGKYFRIKKFNPIFEESKYIGFFSYLKNSFVRYFYDVNSVSCALPKESFQRIHNQLFMLFPLKILNCNILPLFGRGYWFFAFLFIFLIIKVPFTNYQRILMSGLSLYPIYFGVFLSAATVSEYHRLMIPVHYFMLPMFMMIFYLLFKMRKNEVGN